MTNEPTTGEIAGAIRVCENKLECDVCPMRDKPCVDLYALAADRLESQEREIAELTEQNESNKRQIASMDNVIASLTSRAESAERERDAVQSVAVQEYDRGYNEGFGEGYKNGVQATL